MKLIMPSTGSRCHCSLPPGVGWLWPQVMWIRHRDNWISDRSYRHIQIGMQSGVAGMWECEIVRHGVTVQPRLLWALTEAAMNGARWDNYLMLRRLRHVADYFKLCIDNQHQSHGATSLNLVTKSQPPHKCWAFCVSDIGQSLVKRDSNWNWDWSSATNENSLVCQISWYWLQIRTPDKMLDIKTQLNIWKRFVLGPPAHY